MKYYVFEADNEQFAVGERTAKEHYFHLFEPLYSVTVKRKDTPDVNFYLRKLDLMLKQLDNKRLYCSAFHWNTEAVIFRITKLKL